MQFFVGNTRTTTKKWVVLKIIDMAGLQTMTEIGYLVQNIDHGVAF
jgi:hypothetical protein